MDLVFAEFVSAARRAGLTLSPVEAIDAQRAAISVGLLERTDLRDALRSVMVKDSKERAIFDRVFEAYFTADGRNQGTLFDRLRSQGFSDLEVGALDELLRALVDTGQGGGGATGVSSVISGGGELDRLLVVSGRAAGLERMQTPMQVGFYTARILDASGVSKAQTTLGALRSRLRDALGDRGDALVDAVAAELERFRGLARSYVQDEFQRRNATLYDDLRKERMDSRAFTTLDEKEVESVLAEVHRLAERIRGALSVRRKAERRGKLDVRGTIRNSYATEGIAFQPVFKRKKRDRPKLVVLCDVSDSVRAAARFLLVFAYAIQEVFTKTRSFVFVSEVGETTELFDTLPIDNAIALAYSGSVVSVASNSNYGRVFAQFADQYLDALDRHTTVLIIGDARNNFNEVNAHALQQMGTRAKRIVWFNPEPRGAWGFGDSAMPAYQVHCDVVETVYNLESLRTAVDALIP